MIKWSDYEEKQARKFIGDRIDLYRKNLNPDECEEIAWEVYFEVREKYIDDLANTDFWICVDRGIKSALEKFYKIRNERIRIYSPLSLNSQVGENSEELITIISGKHSDFSDSAVFWMFVKNLGELKYKIIRMLVWQEEDYDIIKNLRISYEEYYREKLEIKNIFENEYLKMYIPNEKRCFKPKKQEV